MNRFQVLLFLIAVSAAWLPSGVHADVTTNVPTSVSGGTGAVADIQTNDVSSYSAARNDTISIGGFSWIGGAISSVVLHLEFTVDAGYDGTNSIHVNGVDTAIVPADGDANRTVSIDITGGSFLIDTWPKISSLMVSFNNNDSAAPSDAVLFDYAYLVVAHETSTEIPPTWSDEFEGSGPANPAIWTYEIGYQRNNEWQYYTETNGWQEGGNFVIEGREETVVDGLDTYDYTSSSIRSVGNYSWQYGRAQIRANLPCFNGMWPAIWMVGDTGEWPSNGECDIMEWYSNKTLSNCARGTTTRWTAAWDSANRTMASFEAVDPGWRTNWHVWTIQWDQENVRIYCDNVLMNTTPQSWLVNPVTTWGPLEPFKQPHNIWLNLAIGGNAGGSTAGTTFPVRYYIDYWRVWEGATNNVAPTDIAVTPDGVSEGLPSGTEVGYLSVTDADPAEVISYSLVAGTGDDDNALFSIPEFTSDSTDTVLLKTAAVLNYDDGATRSIRVRATDIERATFTKILTINVLPLPNVQVSTNAVSVPEGATANFSVKLRSLPSNTVTVNVSRVSGDVDLSVQSGSTLSFTPANYTNWQAVTLAAASDVDLTNGLATFTCVDIGGTYNSATVTVSEADSDNDPPVVSAGPNQNVSLDGAALWTPAEISCAAWYDAADATTITESGGTISAWADKSGSNDLTAVNDPQLMTNYMNGHSVVDFASDRLTMASDIEMLGKAAFVVLEADAVSANQMVFGNTGINVQLRVLTGGTFGYAAASSYYTGAMASTNLVIVGQPAVIGYILNSSMEFSFNGVLEAPGGGNDGSGVTSYNQLGSREGTGQKWFDGKMGEVVVTTNLPSTETRQDIEGYLAHKWGLEGSLPGGHPHKSAAPAIAAKVVNLDGTVSDPNSDPLTVTWSLLSGPGGVSFGDSNAVDTTVSITVAGVYVLRLTADDGTDVTSSDVTITVNEAGTETFTLTVSSAHGSPLPSGTSTPASNSVVNASILDSPVTSGTTQYVATGWIGTGSLSSGSGTNTSFTITNDTSIIWQWQTNYWINFETIGN